MKFKVGDKVRVREDSLHIGAGIPGIIVDFIPEIRNSIKVKVEGNDWVIFATEEVIEHDNNQLIKSWFSVD